MSLFLEPVIELRAVCPRCGHILDIINTHFGIGFAQGEAFMAQIEHDGGCTIAAGQERPL